MTRSVTRGDGLGVLRNTSRPLPPGSATGFMNLTVLACLAVLVNLIGFTRLTGAAELSERSGQHLRIVTDLDDAGVAEELVASFDAAVPQWVEFWGLPDDAADGWQMVAYVMRDRAEFERKGLIPDRLPAFRFGYASRETLWVVAQPSDYYTRHLLLHEGVHAFMTEQFGGPGATWFMEGTAELLGTHRGNGASIRVGTVPKSRDEVPYWGRFTLMRRRGDAGAIPTLQTVMRLPPQSTGDAESYGWSWAAVMLLDRYRDTHDALQAAARGGRDQSNAFTRQLVRRLQPQWHTLAARWRLMTHELDYGFTWDRERVEIDTGDPLWDGQPRTLEVRADRGWQSAGVRFPAGTVVRLTADGRCVVADTTKPWTSEPPGVTIRYHRGRPLGRLLVCRLPCDSDDQPTLQPLEVAGYSGTMRFPVERPSWLLFRVNDAVGELDDNDGAYEVQIETIDRN